MPGKTVKSWPMYEALRAEGFSKESAARITNAKSRSRRQSKKSRKRRGKRGR